MESNKKFEKIELGKNKIYVILGDIFKEHADIIVNPVDENLSLHRKQGLAYGIRSIAGVDYTAKLKDYLKKNEKPLQEGKVISTEVFHFKNAKHIFNIVSVDWRDNKIDSSIKIFKETIQKVLEIVPKMNLSSIIFPTFLSFNFPTNLQTDFLLETAYNFLKNDYTGTKPFEIKFITLGNDDYQHFKNKLISLRKQNAAQTEDFSNPPSKKENNFTSPNTVVQSIEYKGTKISLVKGDITLETTDAIVNAANNELWLGGGVAGAIDRAGGRKIQDECHKIVNEKGFIETGETEITTSGNLFKNQGIKYVIHAVGPVWKGGYSKECEQLRDCVWNSLNKYTNKINSISFPAISSGIFGFPKDKCAMIMIETAYEFIDKNEGKIKEIRLTNFDKITVDYFVSALKLFQNSLSKKSNKYQENEVIDAIKYNEIKIALYEGSVLNLTSEAVSVIFDIKNLLFGEKIKEELNSLDEKDINKIFTTSGGDLSKNGVKQIFHANFHEKDGKIIKEILQDLFEKANQFDSLSIYYPKFNLYDELFKILTKFLEVKKNEVKLKEINILFDDKKNSENATKSLEKIKKNIFLESEEKKQLQNSQNKRDSEDEETKINEIDPKNFEKDSKSHEENPKSELKSDSQIKESDENKAKKENFNQLKTKNNKNKKNNNNNNNKNKKINIIDSDSDEEKKNKVE